MPKIDITISDDWKSVATNGDGSLSDEQTLMALERAAYYYRNRIAALHWHKTTAELAQAAQVSRLVDPRNGR